jgi:hypothetical protein
MRDIFAAWPLSAYVKNLAVGLSGSLTSIFLPVGMLDLVPRPHSPPRVTIRGVFLLRSLRHGYFWGTAGMVNGCEAET